MNMKRILITFCLIFVWGILAVRSIGEWRIFQAYHAPKAIISVGNMLYVLASGGLYSYNTSDQSINTYDKSTILSDCDIQNIAWNADAKRLIIVYANGNIDFLQNDREVVNITDFKTANVSGRTVFSIYNQGKTAYFSTEFGVLKVDVANATIAATYNLGFAVEHTYLSDGYIYASSRQKGLYRASLLTNLADKNQWIRVGEYVPYNNPMDEQHRRLVASLKPGGPRYNNFRFIRFKHNKLYTVGGGQDLNPATPQVWNGTEWQIYADSMQQTTQDNYMGAFSIDADPADETHVYVGAQGGLYEYRNGKLVQAYSQRNSPLQIAATVKGLNYNYNEVSTLAFDNKRNLWLFNNIAPTNSLFRLANEEWTPYKNTEFYLPNKSRSLEGAADMKFDSRGLLWMVNDYFRTPCCIMYNTATGNAIRYTSFVNTDGVSYNVEYVHAVAEDLNGNIWICTNQGPFFLTPDDIARGNTVMSQVKVPRNDGSNLADYLLSGVDVSCMAVDKAGRKWFGTNGSGVFCIGEDNITEVHHFMADNSPLLNDYVSSIAINPTTGEVFIATNSGLCSFMSDANIAIGGMNENNVWAYPNPVQPDYTGPVTIRGLESGASVLIVTPDGRLVSRGTASGGIYKWYAIDASNRRVASGVYYVLVASADGEKRLVCKVAVVN